MVNAAPRIIPKIKRIERSLPRLSWRNNGATARWHARGGGTGAAREPCELGQICRNVVTVMPFRRVPIGTPKPSRRGTRNERADHGRRGGGCCLFFLTQRARQR